MRDVAGRKDMYAWMMDHDEQMREESEAKRSEEVATDMLKDKEPLAKILKYSRLTEEKIRELAKKLNVAVV